MRSRSASADRTAGSLGTERLDGAATDDARGLLAAGRRGDMVELFMTQAVGLPAEFVAPLRASPFFPSMEAVAHALVYDAMVVGDFSLPTGRLATVKAPTLVVDGGQTPWLTRSPAPSPTHSAAACRASPTTSTRRPSPRCWRTSSTAEPSRRTPNSTSKEMP